MSLIRNFGLWLANTCAEGITDLPGYENSNTDELMSKIRFVAFEIQDEVANHAWFWISAIAMAFVVATATVGCNMSNNGIIIADGFEHGFIQCGSAEEGGFIMINNGHYNDQGVNDLFEAAQETCPFITDDFYSK